MIQPNPYLYSTLVPSKGKLHAKKSYQAIFEKKKTTDEPALEKLRCHSGGAKDGSRHFRSYRE